jgi:hypothetical protein
MKKCILIVLVIVFFLQSSCTKVRVDKELNMPRQAEGEVVGSEVAKEFVKPEPEVDEMLALGDTGILDGLLIFFKSSEVIEVKTGDNEPVKVIKLEASVQNAGNKVDGVSAVDTHCYDPDGKNVKDNLITIPGHSHVHFGNGRDNMLPGAVKSGALYIEYTIDGIYRIYFTGSSREVIGFNIQVINGEIIATENNPSFDHNIKLEHPTELLIPGSTFSFNNLNLTVNNIGLREGMIKDAVAVNMKVENTGKEKYGINLMNVKFYGPDGVEASGVQSMFYSKTINNMSRLSRNKSFTGDLIFEYVGNGIYTIIFSDIVKNFAGDGETTIVSIKIEF